MILFSCIKTEDVQPTDDNELITSVSLNFTENSVTKSFVAKSSHKNDVIDVIDKITLDANKIYSYSIEILDESKNPAENITESIKTENDLHLFVFKPNPTGILTFSDLDVDANGFPGWSCS